MTLASRAPLEFRRQRFLGRDFHFWLRVSGLDTAAFGPRLLASGGRSVLDDGRYRHAIVAGKPDHRALFRSLTPDGVIWQDGTHEPVDTLVLATGYQPSLSYLGETGALDAEGRPLQRRGVSTAVPGLFYVGLPFQRSFASATIRGVGDDAAYVIRELRRVPGPGRACCERPRRVRTLISASA